MVWSNANHCVRQSQPQLIYIYSFQLNNGYVSYKYLLNSSLAFRLQQTLWQRKQNKGCKSYKIVHLPFTVKISHESISRALFIQHLQLKMQFKGLYELIET